MVRTAAALVTALVTATLQAVGVTYTVGPEGLRIEGVGTDNPLIYDNDWWSDTPDKNYLWAKASLGKADLRGNVVSRDLWDWQKGYLYTLERSL